MKFNSILEWIYRNLHQIVLGLISILCLIFIYLPFILFNNLNEKDLAGHLFSSWYIQEYLFPYFAGWNPYHMLGFPQGEMYPFLLHYVVALLGFILNLSLSFKLVITSFGLAIPYSIYYFGGNLFNSRKVNTVFTLVVFLLLLLIPGYLGFNIKTVFSPGLATSFVSIPLIFYYSGLLLKKEKNIYLLTVILSSIILTHIVTSIIAISITIVYMLMINHTGRLRLLSVLGLSFMITAFYTLPFIFFRSYVLSPKTDPVSIIFYIFIAVLSVAGIILVLISKERKYIVIPVTILLFTLVCIFNAKLEAFNLINNIHPYRFISYFVIILVILIYFYINQLISHKLNYSLISAISITLLVILICGVIIVKNFDVKGREDIDISLSSYKGLISVNYRTADIIEQTRMPYYEPIYQNDGIRFTVGQFEESSFNAPYMWSLSKGFIDDTGDFIEDVRFNDDDLQLANDYFGVNYSLNTGEYICPASNNILITDFSTSCLKDNILNTQCEQKLNICKISDTSMFEVWNRDIIAVSGNWQDEVERWWKNSGFKDQILVEGVYSGREKAGTATVDLISHSSTWDRFSIRINANTDMPVLIRMSYFPKWKAYKDGHNIPISRVSPNLMLISASGDIEFKYEDTAVERFANIFSICGLILLLVSPYLNKKFKLFA